MKREDNSLISIIDQNTLEFAKFIAKRADKNTVVLDSLASAKVDIKIHEDSIVVIPNGITDLLKNPNLIETLANMVECAYKIILVDNKSTSLDINKVKLAIENFKLPLDLIGYANSQSTKIISILSTTVKKENTIAPSQYKVIALIATYNEQDVIRPVVKHLQQNGIDTYIIDNWSNDGTFEKAQNLIGRGVIGVERFPHNYKTNTYDWELILKRKEELSRKLQANWFIHYDADEIRESPWQGITLRDAIYRVEKEGYNAINFTIIDFPPIDDTYQNDMSLNDHFHYCEFGNRPGHFIKISAWQKTEENIDLSTSGGHEVKFDGRKVYPYKFLMRHYPIRSQSHGEKKVFEDRKSRWNVEEKKKGWHNQYDNYEPGHKFLKDPKTLIHFDDNFYYTYLIERLTGIGIIKTEMKKIELSAKTDKVGNYTDPNRYARSFSMEEQKDYIVFHGYQEFKLFSDHLEILECDKSLQRKSNILKKFLINHNLSNRSVFDLGANSGYFCYYALQNGAKKAIALEMDADYITGLESAKKKYFLDQLQIMTENFEKVTTKSDIVIALAFIHWIYSCTAKFGSLDHILKTLSELTNYALIVEWIDPEDPAIKFFDHLNWNQDVIKEEYSYEMFEKALKKYFKKIKLVGVISQSRKIFIAYKTENEIYTDSPIPIRNNRRELISSRILTIQEGVEYWSDVYDDGECIYKRTTSDLAFRESLFLRELNSPFFPKVINAKKFDEYSDIQIEKVSGIRLDMCADTLTTNRDKFYLFVSGCLEILKQLNKKGITHRDICEKNIFIRDGYPVLFDFGWAESKKNTIFTPLELNSIYRPPDKQICDVYSMGMVISGLNKQKFPTIAYLTKLMTIPDRKYRITDIKMLFDIFSDLQSNSTDSIMLQVPLVFYLHLVEGEDEAKAQIQILKQEKRIKEDEAKAQIQILKQQAEETKVDLEQCKEEVASYATSTSWSLTRPLRHLSRIFRRKRDAQ